MVNIYVLFTFSHNIIEISHHYNIILRQYNLYRPFTYFIIFLGTVQ